MTRRPVVNRDELFAAANQLAAQGKKVTALAILAALGGGSLTTIYKHLEEWESLNKPLNPSPSSDEIPAIVQKSFASVWKLAAQEASRQEIALRQEVDQLKKQLKERDAEIEKLETQIKKSDTAVKEAAQLRGRLQALNEQNAKLLSALKPRKKK